MRAVGSKLSGRFILFLVLAIFLMYIPILGSYVKITNTLIHESGHALIALFGGNVKRISLFMNTEGVTYSTQSTWFGGFFTSIAGYVFSSFMAFLSFWLIGRKQYRILIAILIILITLNLVFWVRNLYGLFWLITFGSSFLLLLFKGNPKLVNNVLLLIASILLVESLHSAFEIMVISFIRPNAAGDAGNLAHLTGFIPVQLWGIFFFVQAIWFAIMSFKRGIFKL